MLELIEITAEIEKLLESTGNAHMSEMEFEAQKQSFVIGNSFDVYADSDTINAAKIRELHIGRLDRTR